jgi:SOS-response transcriptional repressor LexA
MSTRMLPVLTYVQAGEPLNDHIDDFAPGAADEYVPVDAIMARKLGPYAFALYVEGDSMEPLFRQGDLVIIDPDTAVRSGDYVVAKVGGKSRATLKKYVDRGVDAQGREQFDLVPLNTNGHHTLRINAGNPGSIIGVVVQKITSFR